MATKCKLTTAVTNKSAYTYYISTYLQNLNLLQPKLWPVVAVLYYWHLFDII